MIKVHNISKSFIVKKQKFTVLKNIEFILKPNQSIGIMGESGSGKSTFALILMKLLNADSGTIFFEDIDITHYSQKKLSYFRKNVQMISQRPESFFDPSNNILQSLQEPLKNFKLYNRTSFYTELYKYLTEFKLSPSQLHRYPHQLSGGEIQRFSILRALLLKPKVLILDECTSMLDISVQAQILHLLKKIKINENISFLLISHDKYIINFMCDSAFVMDKGILHIM